MYKCFLCVFSVVILFVAWQCLLIKLIVIVVYYSLSCRCFEGFNATVLAYGQVGGAMASTVVIVICPATIDMNLIIKWPA